MPTGFRPGLHVNCVDEAVIIEQATSPNVT